MLKWTECIMARGMIENEILRLSRAGFDVQEITEVLAPLGADAAYLSCQKMSVKWVLDKFEETGKPILDRPGILG